MAEELLVLSTPQATPSVNVSLDWYLSQTQSQAVVRSVWLTLNVPMVWCVRASDVWRGLTHAHPLPVVLGPGAWSHKLVTPSVGVNLGSYQSLTLSLDVVLSVSKILTVLKVWFARTKDVWRDQTPAIPALVGQGHSVPETLLVTPSVSALRVSFPTLTPSLDVSPSVPGILTVREVSFVRTRSVWRGQIHAILLHVALEQHALSTSMETQSVGVTLASSQSQTPLLAVVPSVLETQTASTTMYVAVNDVWRSQTLATQVHVDQTPSASIQMATQCVSARRVTYHNQIQ